MYIYTSGLAVLGHQRKRLLVVLARALDLWLRSVDKLFRLQNVFFLIIQVEKWFFFVYIESSDFFVISMRTCELFPLFFPISGCGLD